MPMRVVAVDPASPREDRLAPAVEALSAGGVVAVPTETFYGLAVDALNPEAVKRVNVLKGKAPDAPVLLLLSERDQVGQVADELPELFDDLATRFWPGPLTLVVRAAARVPTEVTGAGRTVAVRVPGLALPRRLAGSLGRPVSGVSANRTGDPPCRTAREVASVFGDSLAVILDGGSALGGAASTILDLCSAPPRLIREGLLPLSALRPFVHGGDLVR